MNCFRLVYLRLISETRVDDSVTDNNGSYVILARTTVSPNPLVVIAETRATPCGIPGSSYISYILIPLCTGR